MKRSSLQWKLTLWFSAALVLMAVLTFIVVFFVSHSVLQKQLRTELIHTVEDNVDEVEFYRSIAQMNQDGDTDHYIRYGVGYLEIDDDFLDQVNGMTTALYHENGSLLYGENPIAAAGMLAFEDGVCRTVRVRGETWYIFDRRLEQNTLRDLWLRGAVPGKCAIRLPVSEPVCAAEASKRTWNPKSRSSRAQRAAMAASRREGLSMRASSQNRSSRRFVSMRFLSPSGVHARAAPPVPARERCGRHGRCGRNDGTRRAMRP